MRRMNLALTSGMIPLGNPGFAPAREVAAADRHVFLSVRQQLDDKAVLRFERLDPARRPNPAPHGVRPILQVRFPHNSGTRWGHVLAPPRTDS